MNPVEFLIVCATYDFFSRGALRAYSSDVVFAAADVLMSVSFVGQECWQ